jgi:hypothetical protein
VNKKTDNLFDGEFTFLDLIKILLLIVTMFSTANIVTILTPQSSWSWIREAAAVGMVEGAFLGFEYATAKAKSKKQVQLATIGFFCSITVIGLFAATSGLLEFGSQLLLAPAGNWLNINWTVSSWITVGGLIVFVAWVVGLAVIHRLYKLADPNKKAELDRIEIEEDVTTQSNEALKEALKKSTPVVATARAIAKIEKDYATELTPQRMAQLSSDVKSHLAEHYNKALDIAVDPRKGFVPKEATTPPLPEADEKK